MKKEGSIVRRYDNTSAGAVALVNESLHKEPAVLTIQKELTIQKKAFVDTAAGKSVDEAHATQKKKHAEELATVKEELTQAIQEGKHAVLLYLAL
ncbi:hypothetical protein MMC06_000169 [Schaereria dolodes]|nr:hypothetical protein [Schaereria dolodes]